MAAAAYPRPQLQRPQWQSLDGEWDFLFDDELRFRDPAQLQQSHLRISHN